MAKKSIKSEDLLDLIQHDDRVIDAIMLRIEAKLTSTIEKIMDKLATAMMETTEVGLIIDQKLQTLTAQFNDRISEEVSTYERWWKNLKRIRDWTTRSFMASQFHPLSHLMRTMDLINKRIFPEVF